jgi:putative two-component system response regulator
MRAYSQMLAEELACHAPYSSAINQRFVNDLYRSSPLHDIGKVAIRDEILLKPGRLTSEEFATMRQHTVIGAGILDQAVARSHSGGFLAMAASIARHHHERFDGTGYPDGLAGEAIPLAARIVAVADVYDALTSVRPYKPAFSPERAKEIIVREDGRHFDPAVVAAFHARFADFLPVQQCETDDCPVPGALALSGVDFAPVADWLTSL